MSWQAKLTGVILVIIWALTDAEFSFSWWFGMAGICTVVALLTEKEEEDDE